MNVAVPMASMAIHLLCVNNATHRNANVSHPISWWEIAAYWLAAPMVANVQQELNVFPLPAASAIVPVPRAIKRWPMAAVLM